MITSCQFSKGPLEKLFFSTKSNSEQNFEISWDPKNLENTF